MLTLFVRIQFKRLLRFKVLIFQNKLKTVAARLLGQVGRCPTNNVQERQFSLHKAIHLKSIRDSSLHFPAH